MEVEKIKAVADKLKSAKEHLDKAIIARKALSFDGHQGELHVDIAGYRVKVTEFDRGYSSKVKRGYEMIHLGCLKIADAEVDKASGVVSKIEQELRDLIL